MKEDLNLLLLEAQQNTRAAILTHQQMAASLHRYQTELATSLRRHLGHARRWQVNSRTWRLGAVDAWLTTNIEYSTPTLDITFVLVTDESPLARLRLNIHLPLGQIPTDVELPLDITLPTTLPATRPVPLFMHRRSRAWKTYPEVTLR